MPVASSQTVSISEKRSTFRSRPRSRTQLPNLQKRMPLPGGAGPNLYKYRKFITGQSSLSSRQPQESVRQGMDPISLRRRNQRNSSNRWLDAESFFLPELPKNAANNSISDYDRELGATLRGRGEGGGI